MKQQIGLKLFIICFGILILFVGCGVKRPQIEPEKDFIFYPPLPNTPRFQYLTTFSDSSDIKQKSSLFKFVAGEKELKVLPIKKPYGVGIFEGVIYVCDLRSNAVIVMNLKKRTFGYMGVTGSGRLKKPVNLFIDKDDRLLYVTDTQRKQIVVFDLEGKVKTVFGKTDEYVPADILIYQGKIYITDLKSHQVLVINKSTGEIEKRIGSIGHNEDELYHPSNLDIFKDKIYISDTTNFRVNIFDISGKHISSFGQIGQRPGDFTRPKGIAVDKDGRILVVDSAFENVQIFNKEHKLLLFMLGRGTERHNVVLPAAICLDYDNIKYFKKYISPDFKAEYLLFVTSQFGQNKVNVYAFGKYEKTK